MRHRSSLSLVGFAFVAALGPALACDGASSAPALSGTGSPAASDGGTTPPTPPAPPGLGPDASVDMPDAPAEPFASATEAEPNNGATTTEVNPMTVPGEMKGAIDPSNDKDIFAISLAPGELWEWTLAPSGALAPHVTVFDVAPDNLNPTVLATSAPGASAKLQHFVLRPGTFLAAVRDARNVPSGTGQGGPTYGYTLSAKRKTPAPIAVTFPATKGGTLASLSSVDLYTFTGTKGAGFDVVVRAARKAPASTLNSRMSLFNLTSKTAVLTNDNAVATTDSEIGGELPSDATYIVIVENEGTDPADLSYEIEFSLR